jgi:hypothetical protein
MKTNSVLNLGGGLLVPDSLSGTTFAAIRPLRESPMMRMHKSLAAAAVAASVLLSSAAYAYTPTALEKAELAQLSPAKQKEVLARATGGNTIHGVIETMLLNQISDDFASGKVVGLDVTEGVIVVQNKKGQLKAFGFDTVNLVLKGPKKP